MKKGFHRKSNVFIIIILFTIFLIFSCNYKTKKNVGLKKGTRLVFQANVDDAIAYETDYLIYRLRDALEMENIEFKTITKRNLNYVDINDINPNQQWQINELLDEDFMEWNYSITQQTVSLSLKPDAAQHIKKLAINQTMETIRNRLKEFRVRKAIVKRQENGAERIIVELPPIKIQERVINIIKTTARLGIKEVRGGPAPDRETLLLEHDGAVPDGCEILRGDPKRTEGAYYLINRVPVITGRDIKESRRTMDSHNLPVAAFTLTDEGAYKFSRFTRENIGKPLAIILDGKIQSVATINDVIHESGIIHGNFTVEEADDLALVLRAGALPVSIKLLEEKTIGSP